MKHRMFSLAKAQAIQSSYKYQLGCVIVKGNRILSKAYNNVGANCADHVCSNVFHAEKRAISRAPRGSLSGAVAYVYRTTKNGQVGSSKPCKRCEDLLRSVGISKVCYTTGVEPYYMEEKL